MVRVHAGGGGRGEGQEEEKEEEEAEGLRTKSPSFACPVDVISTFSILRSLYMYPCLWIVCSAIPISAV